jgi:hypothetical protein
MRNVPKPGGKEEVRFVFMATGLNILPYSGGLLDQPAFVSDAFEQFLAAERVAASKQLTK